VARRLQTLRLSPTRNIHFGYANLGLHVTSKIHSVQNLEYLQPRNLKLTSIFCAIFFCEHFSHHLHHHSCLIPLHTRASTIAETPTPGTLRTSTICVRGWWRGRRTPTRPRQGRARRDIVVMLSNSPAPPHAVGDPPRGRAPQ
jgi:hypothetical protein